MEADVADSVNRLARARRQADARAARRLGLDQTELAAITALAGEGDMTLGQLGERVDLTSGAVTRLADRLEAINLAVRRPREGDRRVVILCATPKAREQARAAIDSWVADVRGAYERLGPRQRPAVARFVQELADIAERHAEQARGAPRAPSR
jgi:MarR family 2-MHQ and catechol resistance regulon transcriptional repressor